MGKLIFVCKTLIFKNVWSDRSCVISFVQSAPEIYNLKAAKI